MSETTDGTSVSGDTNASHGLDKNKKSNKKYEKNNHLCGEIEALGSNVYTYGKRNQGDWYIKTTEAIADYVGHEYSKEMQMLVRNSKQTVYKEPEEPSDEKSKWVTEKYKQQLNIYFTKIEKYRQHKAKVFVIIMGQCVLAMRNKLESKSEFEKWEEEDDVVSLLKAIKQLSFLMIEIRYEYSTLATTM